MFTDGRQLLEIMTISIKNINKKCRQNMTAFLNDFEF